MKESKAKKESAENAFEKATNDLEFIQAAMEACLDSGALNKTGEVIICEAIKKACALDEYFASLSQTRI